ncbi:MAG: hypothetical protein IJP15_08175 [Oscillospiraceae bacterium]|nr:hypothetical protein [Oscillospiraceae bacterium]
MKWKKALSMFLSAVMVLNSFPLSVFAQEQECTHHEHNQDCGYVEAVAESPCTHEHSEDCYRSVTNCIHEHVDCGYVAAVAEVSCGCVPAEDGTLTHSEGCGYVAAQAEVLCDHQCSTESGCVTEEENCQHVHDELCGYKAAVEGSACNFDAENCPDCLAGEITEPAPVCTCAEHCTAENFNEYCEVCSLDYTQCGGTERAVGYDTGWTIEDSILKVTGTLTALPVVEYSDIEVKEGGNLNLGAAKVTCYVNNSGTISSGTFDEIVDNSGTISSGTFDRIVRNSGTISGGTFMSNVVNAGTISSGTFDKIVHNSGTISGGTFSSKVYNDYGTISNAKFETGASLELSSKAPERVIHCVNGEDVALTYNAALSAALGEAAAWYQGSTKVTDGTVPLNYTRYVGEYTITSDTTYGKVNVPANAKYGHKVTIATAPDDGYLLKELTVKQGDTKVEVADNAFTMPAGNVTISATFTLCAHVGTTDSYVNGFCPYGCYEPATQNGDVYEISNAGQLYWFVQQINSGNNTINGKLTANIVVNKGTMTAESTDARAWTLIGYYNSNTDNVQYNGTFDGAGHTISGLYFNNSRTNCVGLFGRNGGTVKNVGVINSYFRGGTNVGGVVGSNNGTVENCYNSSTVTGYDHVGGVAGSSNSSKATVRNCYNTGTVSNTDVDIDGSRAVGGVVGSNEGSTVRNCYNVGSVIISDKSIEFVNVGGVVGGGLGRITNCYYLDTTVPSGVNGEDKAGHVEAKTAEQFASGEVAYLLNGDQSSIVFKQTIDTDTVPKFTGDTVYYGYTFCGDDEKIYTNSSSVYDNKPEHTLTYSASGNVITVACSANCGYTGTATISATGKTYDGSPVAATVTANGKLEGNTIPIVYAVKDGEALNEAPVEVGTYTASITVGEGENAATASVEFTITARPVVETPSYDDSDDEEDVEESKEETIKVPVSGDKVSTKTEATVSGSTATVEVPSEKKLEQILDNPTDIGSVEIDLSGLNDNVEKVNLPLELIEKVAEEAAKPNSKLDSLEVKLPSGSVLLDAKTLQTITEEAECNMIRLVLDKVGEKRLNEKQKDALKGKTVYGGYEAYLYCVKGQKRISDFEGGEATLSVPFKVPAGKSAENFSVWYISDSGNLTRLPTWFDGKNICWSVGHFSDFVILYNANATVKVNPNTGTGEHFFS